MMAIADMSLLVQQAQKMRLLNRSLVLGDRMRDESAGLELSTHEKLKRIDNERSTEKD
jgi:hypothetical protein